VNMVLKQYIENFIIHVSKDVINEKNKGKEQCSFQLS